MYWESEEIPSDCRRSPRDHARLNYTTGRGRAPVSCLQGSSSMMVSKESSLTTAFSSATRTPLPLPPYVRAVKSLSHCPARYILYGESLVKYTGRRLRVTLTSTAFPPPRRRGATTRASLPGAPWARARPRGRRRAGPPWAGRAWAGSSAGPAKLPCASKRPWLLTNLTTDLFSVLSLSLAERFPPRDERRASVRRRQRGPIALSLAQGPRCSRGRGLDRPERRTAEAEGFGGSEGALMR